MYEYNFSVLMKWSKLFNGPVFQWSGTFEELNKIMAILSTTGSPTGKPNTIGKQNRHLPLEFQTSSVFQPPLYSVCNWSIFLLNSATLFLIQWGSENRPFKIQTFLSGFIMVLYKMAAVSPDFKWLGFRISDTIQSPDHLQPNLFQTIWNPD